MSQSYCFWDKIGRAKSVGFRFYSAIGRNESRISSRYLEITSISLICSFTYSRNKELLSFVANFSSFSLAESPLHDLQIMVCSSTMSFNLVWLQIIFCSCVNETALFSFLRSLLPENGRSLCFQEIFLQKAKKTNKQTRWLNDKTIIELDYRKISWFVSVS